MNKQKIEKIDSLCIETLQKYAFVALRISLGIVFLWFGALKVFGVSPVVGMLASTYPFLPTHAFVMTLGIVEVLIGFGLLFKLFLRATLVLLVGQMLGTFTVFFLNPHLCFQGFNPLLITMEGEFIAKNLVLISAALVIGAHELQPLREKKS